MTGAPDCPFCGAGAVERVGQWGGQIITAQWKCTACDSYFEALREDFDDPEPADPRGDPTPASVRIIRRVEWIDTDAAGIYHWTTACRFAEAAEAELHTALGIADLTFGAMPRLAVNFTFRRPLTFNDRVEVTLVVARLGTSSGTYAITIVGPEGTAVEGTLTMCLIDRDTGRPRPWPDDLRRLLSSAGEQQPA